MKELLNLILLGATVYFFYLFPIVLFLFVCAGLGYLLGYLITTFL